MILLSQQTNMFEAQAAIAKHAPQAISNVQKILIFQASKNKTNKRRKKNKKQVNVLWNGPIFLPRNTQRSPGTDDELRDYSAISSMCIL